MSSRRASVPVKGYCIKYYNVVILTTTDAQIVRPYTNRHVLWWGISVFVTFALHLKSPSKVIASITCVRGVTALHVKFVTCPVGTHDLCVRPRQRLQHPLRASLHIVTRFYL